jgi:hypothetical protein
MMDVNHLQAPASAKLVEAQPQHIGKIGMMTKQATKAYFSQ